MKKIIAFTALIGLSAMMIGCKETAASTGGSSASSAEPKTFMDSVSYIIGTDIANSLKGAGKEINLDLVFRGILDQTGEKELAVPSDQNQRIMQEFSKKRQEEMQAEREASSKENEEKGKAFLEENKKKDGVKVTESGLQYLVIKEGTGKKPTTADRVTVHYKGTLIDGKEFDSSYKRGQPTTFPVTGVIKGWTEGLQLMTVGSTYRFFIPSDLAYGARGAGRDIGPNSTLIFEVELKDVIAPAKKDAPKKK